MSSFEPLNDFPNLSKRFLIKRYPNLKLSGNSSRISLDGVDYTSGRFRVHYSKFLMKEMLEDEKMLDKMPSSGAVRLTRADKDTRDLLADRTFSLIIKQLRPKDIMDYDGEKREKESVQMDYNEFILIIDPKTGERVSYDTRRKFINTVSADALTEWINDQEPKLRQILKERMKKRCRIEFNPQKIEQRWEGEYSGQLCTYYNPHVMPEWRLKGNHSGKYNEANLKFLKALMNHLFPNSECRDYVYFWMSQAILERVRVHLLLTGGRGLGKSVLCEILGYGVGRENAIKLNGDFFSNGFNSEIKYKRFVYFEETKVSKETSDTFKDLTADDLYIQEKNVKTTRNYTNYASYVIINNHISETKIESDERKFSVPYLTDKRLDELYSEDEITYEKLKIRNEIDVQFDVFNYILERGEKAAGVWGLNVQKEYKSNLFWEIIEMNLTDRQKKLMEAIDFAASEGVNEILADKAFTADIGMGTPTMGRFLDHYRTGDGNRYGKLGQKNGGKRYIFIDDHLLPNNDINESTGETVDTEEDEEF